MINNQKEERERAEAKRKELKKAQDELARRRVEAREKEEALAKEEENLRIKLTQSKKKGNDGINSSLALFSVFIALVAICLCGYACYTRKQH